MQIKIYDKGYLVTVLTSEDHLYDYEGMEYRKEEAGNVEFGVVKKKAEDEALGTFVKLDVTKKEGKK